MLTFAPATTEEHDAFLDLTRHETAAYLEGTLKLMGATWDEYARLFRTVGRVYAIREHGHMAGFCWIEERERTLHIHGLVLRPEFQGRGIGGQVLEALERDHKGRVTTIELGVHRSNVDAIRLYERFGFRTVKTLDDLGFLIMQKAIGSP